jgi:hypothetical protein
MLPMLSETCDRVGVSPAARTLRLAKKTRLIMKPICKD